MSEVLRAAILAGAVMTATGASANEDVTHRILSFDQLDGWAQDDHVAALDTFLTTCKDFDDPDWRSLCAVAQVQKPDTARAFLDIGITQQNIYGMTENSSHQYTLPTGTNPVWTGSCLEQGL